MSDIEVQISLWLSTGHPRTSSLTEAIEQLFTDSGLLIAPKATTFGPDFDDSVKALEKALSKVNKNQPVEEMIKSKEMDVVRRTASSALTAFIKSIA
ncbi:hypothetical protein [Lysobacter sp. Root667]|uniref:hypothetical protein n=1 Tax=Lysobacter sp. Root667 TaxID=1736581 RepID=UPI00138F4F21|nr:hypothetical protein [Lysobacter sp. Root667]